MTIVSDETRVACKKATTDAARRMVIKDHFEVIKEFVEDAKNSQAHLILWGDPGSSKTSIVEKELDGHLNKVKHKNKITALELYKKLYYHKEKNTVILLDDCESWYTDQQCHSTLMAATDTHPNTLVHWHNNSSSLNTSVIPSSFKYKGTVIITTNRTMAVSATDTTAKALKKTQLTDRMEAFNVNLPDNDWNMLAIRMVYEDKEFQCLEGLSDADQETIIEFIEEHKYEMPKLSFRSVARIANKFRRRPNWQRSVLANIGAY